METVKLQKSFTQAENLSNQCTQMLDEDQTIPKTTFKNILQEPEHEQEQFTYETEQRIDADLINEPQNPMYDTELKLPLSGSRVLIAGSSVLKGINPSTLKEYIHVHDHRGANVLDLYNDIRNSIHLNRYGTIKLLKNINKIIKVFKGKPLQYHLNQQNRNRFQSSDSQYYSNNFITQDQDINHGVT
ncbi:unnamed protein product [Mytilus coruscus]|uniref:Uncharacterized protein n=1 Tax=Mytilus coruscus TaxID=42192 RepID=A0A6J8B5K9_MYTCO|nr:unnamed protein product [Mytilus coruscus]